MKKEPMIRIKGFLGEWEGKPLTDCVNLYSGLTYTPSAITDRSGTLVLRSSNVQNGEITLNDNVFVDDNVVNSKNVERGDIIMVVRNGSRDLIGKHAIIKSSMQKTVIGAFMTGIQSEAPNFFNTLFDTVKFNAEVNKNLGATINQITLSMFKSMEFFIPNIEEQIALGDFFRQLDNLLAHSKQKHQKLSQFKQAMLGKMFPKKGETVPEVRIGGFCGEWKECKLGEVATIKTGSSNRENSDLIGEYTFFDRSQDVRRSNKYLFDCEAVIMAGEGQEFIPKHFIGKFDLHQRSYAIMGLDECNGLFLYYFLHLQNDYFLSQAVGTTVKSLRLPMFVEMDIKLPTPEEQTAIGEFFRQLDNQLTLLAQHIAKFSQIKTALLAKMFV